MADDDLFVVLRQLPNKNKSSEIIATRQLLVSNCICNINYRQFNSAVMTLACSRLYVRKMMFSLANQSERINETYLLVLLPTITPVCYK